MTNKPAFFNNEETSGVDRVTNLTYEYFVNQYLKPCKPVVIKDATKNWIAHEVWDFTFFIKKYGNCQLQIDGKFYKFHDFIDLVMNANNNNPAPYLREMNIPINFPNLMFYLQPELQYTLPNRLTSKLLPKSFEKNWGMRKGMMELLIGGRGSGFPFLHYDLFKSHGFVTQIRGYKEFILYSPVESEYLYPMASKRDVSSIKSIESPDLDKFPLFTKAKPIKVLVREKESIFIPSGWWYITKILSPSIAVLINFINPDNWSNFIEEYCLSLGNFNIIKLKLRKTYLTAIGLLMSCQEHVKP
ncbi:hypothetical protein A6770_37315 [Nostoc minutum NIES-26]|uniref:JmjC domain-containing protein n=1 Tax=Nostoc minutum NIES-26 TaxID=1844469 RepID=A0A367RW46_9NOSO|nr:hypothetical protein A6770_37315 [Nostoc minutum NIES-26]